MEQRKLAEGEKHMVAAAKCLKTRPFGRWKVDWEEAAAEYDKAATAFKVAKAPQRRSKRSASLRRRAV